MQTVFSNVNIYKYLFSFWRIWNKRESKMKMILKQKKKYLLHQPKRLLKIYCLLFHRNHFKMLVNMTSLNSFWPLTSSLRRFAHILNAWKLHGGKGDLKSMAFSETNRYKWDYVAEIFVDLQDLHSNDEIPGIINDINR